MFDVEIYLLESFKYHLQNAMQLTNAECDIEPDEDIAATSGDIYIAILPAGVSPGPFHNTSGQVQDFMYSIKVVVYRRMAATPKDRNASVFLRESKGLNALLSKVANAIDWSASVQYHATNLMQAEHPTWEPIKGAPRIVQADPKPQMLVSRDYEGQAVGGKGTTPFIGFKRGVVFGGMRWIHAISS
jgi:hypothetical protein